MNVTPFPVQYKKILTRLRQEYLAAVKSHLAAFQRMEEQMRGNTLPQREMQELYRLSHDFAGSGATFGFPEISRTARELHLVLKAGFDSPARPDGALSPLAMEKMADFKKSLVLALGKGAEEDFDDILPPMPDSAAVREANDIHIIAGPSADVEALAQQMRHFGYNVMVNAGTADLHAAIDGGGLKALVAFIGGMAGKDIELLQSVCGGGIKVDGVPLPFVIVAPEGDFGTRLAAVRMGAQGFFAPEADALKLIEKIEQMSVKFAAPARYTVLIVDDDEMLAEFYSHALTQTGMKVICVHDPKDVLDVIEKNQIDLLLIDYAMRGCNGQELTSVIRQHERYVSLPIIFISSYEHLQKALTDTGLGIDDFLVKPFMPDRLLAAVHSSAQRAAELKVFMTRDGFTGLLNHVHFNEALAAELARVRRKKHQSAYAILDLDRFKSINDTYGHAAGDAVIRTISRMLQQHLRRTDIIGRCGGEEFGLLLPECTVEQAREVIEKIRLAFSREFFTFGEKKVSVTFSAGLVRVMPGNDFDHLVRAADEALYAAKSAGRNRVVIQENPSSPETAT